jgi:hypothetical protein
LVLTARRAPAGETTFVDAIAVLATRVLAEPLFGYRITFHLSEAGLPLIAGAAFVAIVAALLVVAGSVIPRRTLVVLVYGAGVVALAGVIRSADPATSLLAGWSGGRYFLIGTAAIIAVVISSIAAGGTWPRRAGLVLAMLLSIGVIWDFRIKAPETLGWSENSACIGGADPCVVPVFPRGDWDIHWPGREVD